MARSHISVAAPSYPCEPRRHLPHTELSPSLAPAWSPDGTKIAFQSTLYDPGGDVYVLWADVYVMNLDGTGQLNLTENSTFFAGVPIWSPSR